MQPEFNKLKRFKKLNRLRQLSKTQQIKIIKKQKEGKMKKRTIEILDNFLKRYSEMEFLRENLIVAINVMKNTHVKNGKIMVCGNGGSNADSEHIAGELLKSFVLKRKIDKKLENKLIDKYGEIEGLYISNNMQQGIRCIPLTSFNSFNTAFNNDCVDKMTFAQLVNVLGDEGDTLIAISTSGNSKNVLYAAKVAKVLGINVIALTGKTGGCLKDLADVLLNVPSNTVFEIQEYHLPIYHALCLMLESEIFEE